MRHNPTETGEPYRRKTVIFETTPLEETFSGRLEQQRIDDQVQTVKVKEIVPVEGQFRQIFDPSIRMRTRRATSISPT